MSTTKSSLNAPLLHMRHLYNTVVVTSVTFEKFYYILEQHMRVWALLILGFFQHLTLHSGSLNFLGVESSPCQVAKTAAIQEIIKHAPSAMDIDTKEIYDEHLRAIIQVRFSFTSDEVKEKIVTLCCTSVMVQELLKHWYEAKTVPLCEARYIIQTHTTTHISAIAQHAERSGQAGTCRK